MEDMKLHEFEQWVKNTDLVCKCGTILPKEIESYGHGDGLLSSDGRRYWAYIVCPKCNYEWSFVKLLHQFKGEENERHNDSNQGFV